MLSQYTSQLLTLVKRLLLIYLVYFICRLLFYFFNHSFFNALSLNELILINIYAIRFDTFSILTCNSIFILLSILPFNYINSRSYQKVLLWIYLFFNGIFILFNLIDIAYYPYIQKRSTADILKQAGGQTDLSKLLPQYIMDFWYLLFILVAIIFLLTMNYKKIKTKPVQYVLTFKNSIMYAFLFCVVCAMVTIGIRGGLQRIPFDVVDAGKYTQPQNISLVVNSPFTIIKSLEKDELVKLNFDLQNKPVKTIYDPVHVFKTDSFQKQNVVIIILESFSKEYTKLANLKSYTPFFDSLMDQSLTFTNAYSNGHKSIEGIPAILSSMPSLMENPIINSAYAGNFYPSLASILKPEGYTTAFFHGGMNGTMNFDSYAAQTGYSKYYGMNEYGNDRDFDGFWGIWDEPFYNYSVKKMTEMKEPFHTSIFTLSSHHPYLIPDKYKNKFKKGHLENSESIGYADYALRKFFEEAKKQKWFNNTLFVLTADHSSISQHPFYMNNVGQYSIPVLFYKADNSLKGLYGYVFQQTDIMPSILDHLGYNKPFFSFGNSYKNKENRSAIYYSSSTHFMITDSLLFNYTNYELKTVYKYTADSTLSKNILTNAPYDNYNTYFKAFIQTYNNCLINNTCQAK